jgi:DNA-binding transcriptional LysR family regulator
MEPLGEMSFVFAVAPHHPLASHEGPVADVDLVRYRAIAVADSAQRMSPLTVNLLPGQEVLTVNSLTDKIEMQRRGLGCGYVPEPLARGCIEAGSLVVLPMQRGPTRARLGYAWRCPSGPKGARRPPPGLAVQWWLEQLGSPTTRKALLDSPPPGPPKKRGR